MLKIVHRYLGLVLSIILLLVSLTGTLLLWKKEFLWLDFADARQTIDRSLLAGAINNIESNHPDGDVVFVQLFSEGLSLHKVFLTGRRYAWHNQHGQLLEIWSGNGRFEDWLLDLHHRFLLGNNVGLQIAGFSGLLLMPLLAIGLIIWWSRRKSIRLGLLPKTLTRPALLRSHGNIGAVFVLPIFILALTGVILIYPSQSRLVLVDGFGQVKPAIIELDKFDATKGLPSWQCAINTVYKHFPKSEIRSVTPNSSKESALLAKQSLTISFQQTGSMERLGRSSIKFQGDGQLVIRDEFQQPLHNRVFDFSYPLHTAKLGLLYKLLLTVIGLGFVLLCLFGFTSYVKRH